MNNPFILHNDTIRHALRHTLLSGDEAAVLMEAGDRGLNRTSRLGHTSWRSGGWSERRRTRNKVIHFPKPHVEKSLIFVHPKLPGNPSQCDRMMQVTLKDGDYLQFEKKVIGCFSLRERSPGPWRKAADWEVLTNTEQLPAEAGLPEVPHSVASNH